MITYWYYALPVSFLPLPFSRNTNIIFIREKQEESYRTTVSDVEKSMKNVDTFFLLLSYCFLLPGVTLKLISLAILLLFIKKIKFSIIKLSYLFIFIRVCSTFRNQGMPLYDFPTVVAPFKPFSDVLIFSCHIVTKNIYKYVKMIILVSDCGIAYL